MVLPPKPIHPEGETSTLTDSEFPSNIAVDTYDGKVHIEWDSDAPVTPMGQLPFLFSNHLVKTSVFRRKWALAVEFEELI